jgi:hypothetical protein
MALDKIAHGFSDFLDLQTPFIVEKCVKYDCI